MGDSDFPRQHAELKALPEPELRSRLKKALRKLYGKPVDLKVKPEKLPYLVMALEHDLEVIRYFRSTPPNQAEAKAS